MGPASSGETGGAIQSPHTRIAVLEGDGVTVHEPPSAGFREFRDYVLDFILQVTNDSGMPFPSIALREIIDNLVHAIPCTVSVVVDPALCRIYISDTGPGIPRLDLAMEPGYSTATEEQRAYIRGVGLGFPLAQRNLADMGGNLHVSSEPGKGTYVCLSLVPDAATGWDPGKAHDNLTHRQNNILFLLSEVERIGPSGVASELGISLSTAYRELIRLENIGLICSTSDGKRFLSEIGKSYLQSLLSL